MTIGRASPEWRVLVCWRATITTVLPLSRMARIAIIALMLFAAAPALAQQSETTAPAAPAQTDPSKNAPHPNPLPAGGERERTETPAAPPSAATQTPPSATIEAPPPAATETPPPATADAPPAGTPPPATPPPARTGNVDVRESLCLMIESAARAQNLPLEFFARVIWQESRFQADVVGPRTRSGDRAQGIAQFMPRTAAERGLLDPFDPVQALPKSAEFLRELADQFGNLGLAAAAYNAGPGRLREFLSGRRPLPAETRHYVLAITGISVDEWASSGKREPLHVPKAGCGELMALLHRAPNPFVQKLEERVNVVAAAPWGVQLAAGFSRDHALANYASLAKRYAELLTGRDPSLLSSILRSRGTQPFYQVRVGAETRNAAETLCGSIRRAGGACFVLRNRG
jgi:soluble lytic murein transglycosylase-like protein